MKNTVLKNENKTSDILKICLTVFLVSLFVSTIVMSVASSAQSEKPRAKVRGNTLSVLSDVNVQKVGKPKADNKLFLVISLNTYAPEPAAVSTVNLPQPLGSKDKQKFNQVKSYLKGTGLKVVQAFSDLSAIWVEGTVAQVEKAFGVSINQYKLNGKEFYANDADPLLPADIADAVISVAGLENYVAYEPQLVVASSQPQGVAPSIEVVGPPFDPYEIRAAYGFTGLLALGSPNKLNGKGINVAIIDAYGNPTMAADWSAFCTGTVGGGAGPWSGGALPTTPAIATFYPSGAPVGSSAIWALETAMDVEWVHAVAPGAKINLVVSKDNSFTYMLAAYQWTIDNKKGAVISMSFGAREIYIPASYLSAWSAASRKGAKNGATMLASSGDSGYDGWNIIHPSSDPYTVAVGGTELVTIGSYPGTWSSETAWSGSGGGKSILFAKPAWQYGTNVPLDGVRDTPDVSLVADPYTGVYVRCASYSPPSVWWQVGGTSLSAPLWAGFIAIVDQAVGASGSTGGIGYANPWLYRVFRSSDYLSAFRDITSGNNGGYSAGTAYDLVTGIGTLKAWNLLYYGAEYLRMPQNVTYIPGAKAIAVTSGGTMYIGTFQRPPGVSWPYTGVLYELEKGSTTPRALFKAGGGITDVAVDKNGKVYVMTYTKLYKYDPVTGVVTTLVSGLNWGWGVFVDASLNVYFTDNAGAASGGGLYWIPAGGSKTLLKSFGYLIGVYVDSGLNIYVTDSGQVYKMDAAHTTWTTWKTSGSIDLHLDGRKTAYMADWTAVDLMDDYRLMLIGAKYDENLWVDSKTGIYYVNWEWDYGATTGQGYVMYLPPEKPT